MAEPFSLASGALGVIDICTRVAKYLRSVRKTAKTLDSEIETLEHEIAKFQNVFQALEHLCKVSTGLGQHSFSSTAGQEDPCDALWAQALDLVKEGKGLVERFRALLQAVVGDDPLAKSHKLDDYRKAVKFLSKDAEFAQLRRRFGNINMELNTMLCAIDL